MHKFICKNCNFRFDSNDPLECPYCGKRNLEKEKTASELLLEVERILNKNG